MPKLTTINTTEAVTVRELGRGHEGIVWTVQPENFPALIERVNRYGGPDMWSIVPASEAL